MFTVKLCPIPVWYGKPILTQYVNGSKQHGPNPGEDKGPIMIPLHRKVRTDVTIWSRVGKVYLARFRRFSPIPTIILEHQVRPGCETIIACTVEEQSVLVETPFIPE